MGRHRRRADIAVLAAEAYDVAYGKALRTY